jgi:hypothetical protein
VKSQGCGGIVIEKDCGGRRLYAARRRARESDPLRQAVTRGLFYRRAGTVRAVTSLAANLFG